MNIYLNGVGMCTSLGMNRVETQTQYLAREKRFFKDPNVVGVDGLPVCYAPVFPISEMRNLERRLQELSAAAIRDLLAQVPETGRNAHIVIHLPAWLQGDPFGSAVTDWPIFADWTPSRFNAIWSSKISFVKAVGVGVSVVRSDPSKDVILLSLDTFLSAELLDYLTLQGRILNKQQPHGMIPSEAGVALRITTQARLHSDAVLGWIDGHWEGQETQDVKRPETMLGDVLAKIISAGTKHAPVDRLLIDANGERWRSEEMSMALARATNISDELAADFETPPLQLGYSGGAMGAVMVGLALGRGYESAKPGTQTTRQFISSSTFIGQRDGLGVVRVTAQEELI